MKQSTREITSWVRLLVSDSAGQQTTATDVGYYFCGAATGTAPFEQKHHFPTHELAAVDILFVYPYLRQTTDRCLPKVCLPKSSMTEKLALTMVI